MPLYKETNTAAEKMVGWLGFMAYQPMLVI